MDHKVYFNDDGVCPFMSIDEEVYISINQNFQLVFNRPVIISEKKEIHSDLESVIELDGKSLISFDGENIVFHCGCIFRELLVKSYENTESLTPIVSFKGTDLFFKDDNGNIVFINPIIFKDYNNAC